MNVTLRREDQDFVEEQIRAGRFASVDDVVGAALERLRGEHPGAFGGFDEGELDALIADGDADIAKGDVLTVEQIREILRRRSQDFRGRQGA